MGGGPFCKVPNINHCRHLTILLRVLLNLLCPVHTYRLTIWKVCFVLTLITMIIITMIHTVTFHVCHLWIKPVALGKSGANTGRAFEKVDGRVCVWSRPGERFAWPAWVQAWTPLDSYGTSLGELFVSVTIATMHDLRQIVVYEWNAIPQQRVQQLIFSMRRRYESIVAAFGGSTHY